MVESIHQEKIEVLDNSNSEVTPDKLININIGVLGHIDSGKTSLCRALSTIASTAGFDKNPQSKERGITLDLGFSAFVIRIPTWFKEKHGGEQQFGKKEFIQFTLVDCPGHASLMKTIIGGASIIDFMMLIVDSQKLIQTQTAECIVLGEVLMDKMIIAFNKIDMFPEGIDDPKLPQQIKKLRTAFARTKFGADLPVVPVSATAESLKKVGQQTDDQKVKTYGIDNLIKTILDHIDMPNRAIANNKQHFLYSIDHCFQIKGQGTVVTGTVLSGCVKVGDSVEFPALKQQKKVKSMQMFRKPVQSAVQGDRVGICFPQLDSQLIERGLAATPQTVRSSDLVLAIIKRVPYYQGEIKTKAKFHITLGHQTAIGQCQFFSIEALDQQSPLSFNLSTLKNSTQNYALDFKQDYQYEDILIKQAANKKKQQNQSNKEESKVQVAEKSVEPAKLRTFYAFLYLEKEILVQEQSLIIGSKLDTDTAQKSCRLAFSGQVIQLLPPKQYEQERKEVLEQVKIIKEKLKYGKVDRVNDRSNILIKDLFSKETNPDIFIGLKVYLSVNNQSGTILGTFGKSGKLKVKMDDPIDESISDKDLVNSQVYLRYKQNMMKKQANKFK